jgi:hypothetical protein
MKTPEDEEFDRIEREIEIKTRPVKYPRWTPWVSLTDKEIDELFESDVDFRDVHAFSRAIEAKLKDKNT